MRHIRFDAAVLEDLHPNPLVDGVVLGKQYLPFGRGSGALFPIARANDIGALRYLARVRINDPKTIPAILNTR